MLHLPREHGAYGQMAVPLVSALTVAGVRTPSLLTAVAVVMAFVAHEPLLVLTGARGERARRDAGPSARLWLVVTVFAALSAGLMALWLSPAHARPALLLPLPPALALFVALGRGREKDAWAQVCVSLAFSLAAVPVCVSAGAPTALGLAVALPFAVVFVAATLAVRVVVLGARGRAAPRARAMTQVATVVVASAGLGALAAAAAADLLPWSACLAAAPAAGSAVLALVPPAPRHLRAVGWAIVAMSLVTALVVVTA
ncbi:MAG TPA: YwiC-like family protein [Vicinamibacterales bacterium]|nr:YwiC-like family protein [Vicinamibacterales bacterium]